MNDLAFGFKPGDLKTIVGIIDGLNTIKKAVVFGSRAKGNFQAGSDIDIAVWSANNHDALLLYSILNEETLLPYKFDVIKYDDIDNIELKQHIDRRGVIIYEQDN